MSVQKQKTSGYKRNMYYVIYDIVDDNLRSETIQILKNNGFTKNSKSVFCGSLS